MAHCRPALQPVATSCLTLLTRLSCTYFWTAGRQQARHRVHAASGKLATGIVFCSRRSSTTIQTRICSARAMAAAANGSNPLPATAASAAAAAEAPQLLTDEVREQFKQQIQLTAIRIPKQQTTHYMKILSKHLFNKPRLRNVLDDGEDPANLRRLLLDEALTEADLATRLVEGGDQTIADVVQADGLSVTTALVEVDYSYWPAHTVLRRLLPEGLEVPSAFESVGHVAHLNLRKELLPYKHVIGQVILDKNPRLRTVVNKLASIENEYRVFPMELLAGEDSTETEVRQHGARFRLDFRKVYWNSRLEGEHHRLVKLFQPGEAVVDAMAGIGPFAIPAALKGCLVYANDLNPDSYQYLCTNIRLNRVQGKVLPFRTDGREFLRAAAAGRLDVAAAAAVLPPAADSKRGRKGQHQQTQPQQRQEELQNSVSKQPEQRGVLQGASTGQVQQAAGPRPGEQQQPADGSKAEGASESNSRGGASGVFQHVVMNLPAAAVEFLDALSGSFCPRLWAGQQLPMVHVYTFAKGEHELAAVRQRVEAALGAPLDCEPRQHTVRDVAPGKVMLCVSFRLPAGIAFAEAHKRQKLL